MSRLQRVLWLQPPKAASRPTRKLPLKSSDRRLISKLKVLQHKHGLNSNHIIGADGIHHFLVTVPASFISTMSRPATPGNSLADMGSTIVLIRAFYLAASFLVARHHSACCITD
jgi:hypothetical protein